MITQAEKEAIPKFVETYKTYEPLSRKKTLEQCRFMASKHPDPDTRDLNALLYPELLKAEKELTPAEKSSVAENPIVTPAEISAALISVAKPLAGIFTLGAGIAGIAFVTVKIISAVLSAVSVFISAGGWIIGPIIAFLAMALSAKDAQPVIRNQSTSPPQPNYGGQNININITGHDGRINVNQQ